MNKKLLILPLLVLGGQAVAQSDMTVNLKDKAVDSITVYVSNEAFDSEEYNFTLAAKGGKVKVRFEETTPREICLVSVPGKKRVNFTLVPGAKVKVSGTWENMKVSGHDYYKDMEAYEKSVKDTKQKQEDLRNRINELAQAEETRKAAIEMSQKEYPLIMKELTDKSKSFIASHPKSAYSVYLAVSQWRGDERNEQLAQIDPEVRNGFMKSYTDAVAAQEKKQQEERERLVKEREERMAKMQGADAPAFTLPAIDGTELGIASLKGKVTVIDFWGKWCYWCMKGMPDMKKYYEKYAGKLEILGVNYGDTEEVWKKTVEENELTWKHVRMDRANKEQTAILQQYGVSGFPTKVILSAEGKIIKVVVGEDPAFYTLLDELLGE